MERLRGCSIAVSGQKLVTKICGSSEGKMDSSLSVCRTAQTPLISESAQAISIEIATVGPKSQLELDFGSKFITISLLVRISYFQTLPVHLGTEHPVMSTVH
jgi:hypothetical protein